MKVTDVKERVTLALTKHPGVEEIPREQLLDMIDDSICEIRNLTNRDEDDLLPDGLIPATKELALIKLNRNGTEGITVESQSSGGSTSYSDTLPARFKMQIYKYRKLRL